MEASNLEYFPPLDRCLEGNAILISWATTFLGLATSATDDGALERFLSDKHTKQFLVRPFNAFPPPTAQSKATFVTWTAAIQVTPGKFDIQQLKDDALWLSGVAKIDELTALRIVVIEWQSRAEIQLLSGFSEEEESSAQNVANTSPFASSFFSARPITASTEASFSGEASRRRRLLRLYLSERRHFLKTIEILVRAGLSDTLFQGEKGDGSGRDPRDWIDAIGKTILNVRHSKDSSVTGTESFLLESFDAFQCRVQGIVQGSGMLIDEDDSEQIEAEWEKCQLLEMIHILQLIFSVADATQGTFSSSLLLSWLRFIGEHKYFEGTVLSDHLAAAHPAFFPSLQALVSIVTLTLLKLSSAIKTMVGALESSESLSASSRASYLMDANNITEIHALFEQASSNSSRAASPAVFAWCLVMQNLREILSARRDFRSIQQPQAPTDGFGEGDSSISEAEGLELGGSSSSKLPPTASFADTVLDVYERILNLIVGDSGEGDPIQQLASNAVDQAHVFGVINPLSTIFCTLFSSAGHGAAGCRMRIVLLEFVRCSLVFMQYSRDLLEAVLALLSGGQDIWTTARRPVPPHHLDPTSLFLADAETLVPKVLNVAYARFPFECIPFVKLVQALAASPRFDDDSDGLPIISLLQSMQTFTQALPDEFRDYDTVREEENLNQVILRSDLTMFFERGSRRTRTTQNGEVDQFALSAGLIIPTGAEGRVLSEGMPVVIQWIHHYSGLHYLARLLDSILPTRSFNLGLPFNEDVTDVASETIGLFAVLLTSSTQAVSSARRSKAGVEAAQELLRGINDNLGGNADIVTVILDHFENEVQQDLNPSALVTTTEFLASCAGFITALVPVLPGRVWPFFARSALLDLNGRGGRLLDIVSGAEIVTGRFPFLTGCIRIFEALLDDAVTHTVARKLRGTGAERSDTIDNLRTGVSEQNLCKVILAMQRVLLDVFRSFLGWKFQDVQEKLNIGSSVLALFNRILTYAHSTDNSSEQNTRILGALKPAADYLVDIFLSPSTDNLSVNALLQTLAEGLSAPPSTLFLGTTLLWNQQTAAALDLCHTLIRIDALRGKSNSRLENRLFESLPILVRLYCSFHSLKLPTVTLLDAMITNAATTGGEPPSLLGHLGPSSASNFLKVLTRFSKPIEDQRLDVAIWKLMSAIVSSRQQWFAIYLFTGAPPRNSLKAADGKTSIEGPAPGKRMLAQALDELVELRKMPPKKSLAMLEFVVLSADYWPWTLSEISKHEAFIATILSFMGDLEGQVDFRNIAKGEESCLALQLASLSADLMAIYSHLARQQGDRTLLRRLLPKLSYFIKHAAAVVGYNESLHANLNKNLSAKFPGYSLSSFKRTKLHEVDFGDEFFYDTTIAEKTLGYNDSWLGARGTTGFSAEMIRANINWSLVKAQELLLYSWRTLILEISRSLASSIDLQECAVEVVKQCLIANQTKNLPSDLFERLLVIRFGLAFVLMQRLTEARSTVPEMGSLLFTTWDTIKLSDIDFELSLANCDVDNYRPLLRILFLSLQAHLGAAPNAQAREHVTALQLNVLPVIIEILDVVVARGFRHFTVALHDNIHANPPEDFVLITAILQSCLRIPAVESVHLRICEQFVDQETPRAATTLFSWSDQLTIDGDPIYGELAILFLVELSSIPSVAEQLALEGVLSHLSNANLTSMIRSGARPLDSNPRLYQIWTRGFLPLSLNLLRAVGPLIAPEVSQFLSQFRAQLELANNNFDNKPAALVSSAHTAANGGHFFTLSMAVEAHSLTLITCILDRFRSAGASTGVVPHEIAPLEWDAAGVKEDIEYWLARRGALRERLLPVDAVEEQMAREPASQTGKGGGGAATSDAGASIFGADAGSHSGAGSHGSINQFEERFVAELSAVVGLLSQSS